MAFNIQNWARMSANANTTISTLQAGGLTGSPSMFSYITPTDDIATILNTNYFGQQAVEVNQSDSIYCVAADGIFDLTVLTVNEQTKTVIVVEQGGGGGTGNVVGPVSSTNHAIARYAGTAGTNIANTGITIDDGNNMAGIDNITMTGVLDVTGNVILASGGSPGGIYFYNNANTYYTGIQSGSTNGNFLYKLPDIPPQEAGMTLLGNTDGTMLWGSATGAQWISTASPVTMVSGNGYIPINNVTRVVFTLPSNPTVGDSLEVRGEPILGPAGWKIQQPAGNTQISLGTATTVAGSSGYLQSTDPSDAIYMVCTLNNGSHIEWTAIWTGNIAANTGSGVINNNPINVPLPIPVTQGGTGATSVTAYGTVVAGASSSVAMTTVSPGTAGQVLTSNGASAAPTYQNAGGGGGENFQVITSGPQAMVQGTTYMTNSGSLIQCNIPASCTVGAIFGVQGMGTGGWKLQANTGQIIHFNSSDSSSGGYLASTNRYDSAIVVCSVANTEFIVFRSGGAAITVG